MTEILGQRLVDVNVPARRKKSRLEGESDLAVNAGTERRRAFIQDDVTLYRVWY